VALRALCIFRAKRHNEWSDDVSQLYISDLNAKVVNCIAPVKIPFAIVLSDFHTIFRLKATQKCERMAPVGRYLSAFILTNVSVAAFH
jgi:hypothetical protein